MNVLNRKIIALLGLWSVTNLFAGEVVVQIDGDDPIERYAAARISSTLLLCFIISSLSFFSKIDMVRDAAV